MRPADSFLRNTAFPLTEPVSLAEAKAWLHLDDDDSEDELVASLVAAARQYVEAETGLALVTQTWELLTDRVGPPERWWTVERRGWSTKLPLPVRPAQSVESIVYRLNGTNVTLAASNYKLVGDTLVFTGDVPVSDEALGVTITFKAGFGEPIDVPDKYRQAIRLLVTHGYENREPVVVGQATYELALSVRNIIGRKVRV